jgi:hypothetical protein
MASKIFYLSTIPFLSSFSSLPLYLMLKATQPMRYFWEPFAFPPHILLIASPCSPTKTSTSMTTTDFHAQNTRPILSYLPHKTRDPIYTIHCSWPTSKVFKTCSVRVHVPKWPIPVPPYSVPTPTHIPFHC